MARPDVGHLDHRLEGRDARLESRAAGRDGRPEDPATRHRHVEVAEGDPDPLGSPDRIVAGGAVEDDEELLAAVAGDEVGGPEAAGEEPGERPQDGVAGDVAVAVVQVAEVVQVEQDRRHRPALLRLLARAEGAHPGERVVEEPAVVELGERVADRGFARFGVQAGVGDRQGGLRREQAPDLALLVREGVRRPSCART